MTVYYLLAVIFSFGWWPVLVVIWAAVRASDPKKVYYLAFFAGLFSDFLAGKLLGTTAIIFLLIALVIYFWKWKI